MAGKFYFSGERIKYIDSEIRANNYPNPKKVSEKFGVKERTIRRDFQYMRDRIGAPLAFDRANKGYYYTNDTYNIPQVYLSDRELFAMSIASKVLSQYEKSPYFSEVEKVFHKVVNYLPESAFEQNNMVSFAQRPFVDIEQNLWESLNHAIEEKLCVNITYEAYSNDGEITERIIHPYHLRNKGNWYLFAYCEKREAIREFALARIKDYQVTEDKFMYPKDFDFDQYLSSSFDWEKGQKKEYLIKLRFSKYQSRWIRERVWHETQKIQEQSDGSLILSFTVKGLVDVSKWIMYHGSEVEVIEPKELRDKIIGEITKMRKMYK